MEKIQLQPPLWCPNPKSLKTHSKFAQLDYVCLRYQTDLIANILGREQHFDSMKTIFYLQWLSRPNLVNFGPQTTNHVGSCQTFGPYCTTRVFFTSRRYALRSLSYRNSAWLSVRPSVCLSHSWTVSTWFDLRSLFLHHMVAPWF